MGDTPKKYIYGSGDAQSLTVFSTTNLSSENEASWKIGGKRIKDNMGKKIYNYIKKGFTGHSQEECWEN